MPNIRLPLAVVIEGIDKLTGPMRKVQRSLATTFAPLGQLKNSLVGLGEAAGLPALSKALGKVSAGVSAVHDGLSTLVRRMAWLGGAGVGLILGLEESFAREGAEVLRSSQKLGVGVQALQELRYAARQYGVEQDALDTGLTRMARGIGDAAQNQGTLGAAFQRLQIPLRGTDHHLRRVDELLPEVADRLNELADQGRRTAVTMQIFGRGGAALTPMLRHGGEMIALMRDEARRLGLVMSEEDVAGAEAFIRAQGRVEGALTGLRNVAAGALAPALTDLANKLTGFLVEHREDVQRWASDFGQKLPAALTSLGQTLWNLLEAVKPIGAAFSWLGDTFGYANVAAVGLGTYVGGQLVIGIAQLIPALITLGTVLFTTVIPALISMAVAMWANPITWVVAGIAALVAAGIWLWKNWDKVGTFFVGLWGWIKSAFSSAFSWIIENVPWLLGPVGLIIKHWTRIKDFFSGLWDTIREVFGQIVTFVSDKVSVLTSILPDWLTGKTSVTLAARTSVPLAAGGGGPAMVAGGEAKVSVRFENAPKGTRLVPQGNSGVDLDTSMGYSMVGGPGL